MELNHNKINELIKEGFIYKKSYFNDNVFMYCYTAKTQYEKFWIPETIICSGIIFNKEGKIIARPFPKFFNLYEYKNKGSLPLETFNVYEKLDGSLGILYFYENQPYIATKGSFDSEQSLKATEILYDLYKESIPLLDKKLTYLFEIIYPENRIVVNYGDYTCLTLLAIIETSTGKELNIHDFEYLKFPIIKKYDAFKSLKEIEEIINKKENNKEGFVLHFKNGLRIKCKYNEYVKLHSLISKISNKKIWELLKDNIDHKDIIGKIPDELYNWFQETKNDFIKQYNEIEFSALNLFEHILNEEVLDINNRKEIAHHFMKYKYPSILFSMLDKKDYSKYIWKILEPIYEIPAWNKNKNESVA